MTKLETECSVSKIETEFSASKIETEFSVSKIETECSVSKRETDCKLIQNRNGFEMELPLLKTETEIIPPLFYWNLKSIRNINNSVSIN